MTMSILRQTLHRLQRFPRPLQDFTTSKPSPSTMHPPSPTLSDTNLLGDGSFINNIFLRSLTSQSDLIVTNPANNHPVRRLSEATDLDIRDAISTSSTAYLNWRNTSTKTRAAFLRAWHLQIHNHRTDLARLITLENGKPLPEAEAEITYAASFLSWNEQLPAKATGTHAIYRDSTHLAVTTRVPIGVCLLITPWNFPAAMLLRKAAPALAAGNAVIAKPSELTPLTALALAELARRAGAPAGLLNVVATSRAEKVVGEILDAEPVRMVSFTGSTRVGKLIAERASRRVLKTSLELGGHAPFIVFGDADVDAAVDGLMRNKFRCAGQTCISANRVFVQKGEMYERFCERVWERMSKLEIGDGMVEGTEVGPLISGTAVERVRRHVDDAVARGGRLLLGGGSLADEGGGMGNFFRPTLVVDVPEGALLGREETFGPVVGVFPFEEEVEVVRRANCGTEMGLAGYVFTKDGGRGMRMVRELEVGMVGVNEVGISGAETPFGGVKESGVGREGGPDGLEAYTEVRHAVFGF